MPHRPKKRYSHELNSSLGAVNGANQVRTCCLSRIETALAAAESVEDLRKDGRLQVALRVPKHDTRVICLATERMTSLVQNLQHFAQLDQAEYRSADVRKGVESVLELLGLKLGSRVRVEKDHGEVPEIGCYPGALHQVFLTLLTNAAEAIDGEGRIGIRVRLVGGRVQIQFSDSGRGIPRERLERLFEFDFSPSGSRVKMAAGLVATRRRKRTSRHGACDRRRGD